MELPEHPPPPSPQSPRSTPWLWFDCRPCRSGMPTTAPTACQLDHAYLRLFFVEPSENCMTCHCDVWPKTRQFAHKLAPIPICRLPTRLITLHRSDIAAPVHEVAPPDKVIVFGTNERLCHLRLILSVRHRLSGHIVKVGDGVSCAPAMTSL